MPMSAIVLLLAQRETKHIPIKPGGPGRVLSQQQGYGESFNHRRRTLIRSQSAVEAALRKTLWRSDAVECGSARGRVIHVGRVESSGGNSCRHCRPNGIAQRSLSQQGVGWRGKRRSWPKRVPYNRGRGAGGVVANAGDLEGIHFGVADA